MKKIYDQIAKLKQYSYLQGIVSWDLETEMPQLAHKQTADAAQFLGDIYYELITDPTFIEEVNNIDTALLSEVDQKVINELKLEIFKIEVIPKVEYVAFLRLLNESHVAWVEARNDNNYSIFAPFLEKIINYQKKFISYYGYEQHPYDALLNEYERGMTVSQLDPLFDMIATKLTPLLKLIAEQEPINNEFLVTGPYAVDKQKEFCHKIAEKVGFDFRSGVLKESAHPFSMSLNKHNIRMTTHFYENDLNSAISSTLHETGHSLYEQGVSDDLLHTNLDSGVSLGIHESQSRLYENYVGKSLQFWEHNFEQLQELFPEHLSNVTVENFYKAINKVQPSLIRVEADELTYPFHVMIRYQIEKEIFSDEVSVDELPKRWNELYKEYLGIDVPSDSQGILQDVHWSMGSFGYFPTYVLGSAYASQIMNKLIQDIDFDKVLSGEFSVLKSYLGEHIHQFGSLKDPDELINNFTNEKFNPEYYITYLFNKYKHLYNI